MIYEIDFSNMQFFRGILQVEEKFGSNDEVYFDLAKCCGGFQKTRCFWNIEIRELHGDAELGKGGIRIEAEEVEAIQWAIENVEVEVGAIGKSRRIGGEPAADFRVVKTFAEVEEAVDRALGAEAPGIDCGG